MIGRRRRTAAAIRCRVVYVIWVTELGGSRTGMETTGRGYEPYYTLAPNAIGSLSAAAAKAGHDVLVGLFPVQTPTLDREYANFLVANGGDPSGSGTAVGGQAAAHILALRSNDGRFPPDPAPFL